MQSAKVKMKSQWITVGPNPMTSVHIRRGKIWTQETQKEEGLVMIKAQTGVLQPQVKEIQELLATSRRYRRGMQ